MATKKIATKAAADAAQPDPREQAILGCIQNAFGDAGLTPITSPLDNINWAQIPKDVRNDIADSLETCISQQIKPIGDLSGPLAVLAAHEPVMSVADLISDLIALLDSMGA
jgi:hypothetical protein